jgi:hypothetical protein
VGVHERGALARGRGCAKRSRRGHAAHAAVAASARAISLTISNDRSRAA